MRYTEFLNNKSILNIINRCCSYVDPRLMDHGMRVAYIMSKLLRSSGRYSEKEMRDLCILSALHDVGAYKTEEISRMVQFETSNVWDHSVYGYLFIQRFSPLSDLAPIVLLHHLSWAKLQNLEGVTEECRTLAQLLNIADRLDVYLEYEGRSWLKFTDRLKGQWSERFSPEATRLMLEQDFSYSIEKAHTADEAFHQILWGIPFTPQEIMDYLEMLIFTIDFRSAHTVTHTITTTSISYELAFRMETDQKYISQIVCGSLLHDLGKIAIPVEILEFPGKLSPQAMTIMRTHVDLTEKIFGGDIEETIQRISLRHHEKLNGTGYPRGLSADELTSGERIVAVADIMSALAGTRSYKEAFSKDRILGIIGQMRDDGLLDHSIVDLAIRDFDAIMDETQTRCRPALELYENVRQEYQALMERCAKI